MTFGTAPIQRQVEGGHERWRRPTMAVVAFLIAFAIIFPRSATAIFLVPVAGAIGMIILQPGLRGTQVAFGGFLGALSAFAGWSLLSAIWSVAPLASISKPLYLLGGSIGVAVLVSVGRQGSPDLIKAIGFGVLIGFGLGAGLVCIETLTDQSITQFFMNHFAFLRSGYEKHLGFENGVVVHVGDGNINRRATVVSMLLFPSALLLLTLAAPTAKKIGLGLLLAVTVILLTESTHQSSQAAIVAGGLAFGLAQLSALWARRLVAAGWCASCLLVVPLVIALHSTDMHKDSHALFHSARHRIVIWYTTAEKVMAAPLIGIGADATATQTLAQSKQEQIDGTMVKDGAYEVSAARHAHNVFLQIWYELGAVGAVLFMVVGLAALALISRARGAIQPFLLAQFGAAAGMMAFSFSIWQLWFQGAIGLGILALIIAVLVRDAEDPTPG